MSSPTLLVYQNTSLTTPNTASLNLTLRETNWSGNRGDKRTVPPHRKVGDVVLQSSGATGQQSLFRTNI